MPAKLLIESSRSRRGKHAERKIAFIVSKDHVRVLDESYCSQGRPMKPTYSKGRACELEVEVAPGSYAVQLRLVRNLWGRVKGCISVYDASGSLLYRASIRKLKVRPSRGDYRYHWVVEKVIEHIKLSRILKRYKLPPRLYKMFSHA